MAPNRRRSRSVNVVAAVAVLVVAAAVTIAALVMATVVALTAATVVALVAGVTATGLMSAEILGIRRAAARERAQVADGYRRDAVVRSVTQKAFVDEVTSHMSARDDEITRLRADAVEFEIRLARAEDRVSAERARVAGLVADTETAASDLASARADLLRAQDALVASETAEAAMRAQVEAWEQAAATPASDTVAGSLGRHRRTA